jgi:arylformamidase
LKHAAALWIAVAVLPVLSGAQQPAAGAWIDVSAPIDPAAAPVYPGNAPIKLDFMLNYDKGSKLALSSYSLGAHTGTHVDAPMHFIKGGIPVDRVPLERLVGPARVIDCSADAMVIDAAELNKHDWKGAKRILFRTRNSRNGWMSDPVFHEDFTYVAPDAARLLADAGVQLVGIDYLSIEKFHSPDPQTHLTLLGKGIPVIEGLSLKDVTAGDYDLIVLPLRIVRLHRPGPFSDGVSQTARRPLSRFAAAAGRHQPVLPLPGTARWVRASAIRRSRRTGGGPS